MRSSHMHAVSTAEDLSCAAPADVPGWKFQGERSSNKHAAVCQKLVLGDLQVEGRRTLASAPRGIIVAAVAGAEPAVEVARIGQGHTPCRTVISLKSPSCMLDLHTALLSSLVPSAACETGITALQHSSYSNQCQAACCCKAAKAGNLQLLCCEGRFSGTLVQDGRQLRLPRCVHTPTSTSHCRDKALITT